MNSRIVGPDRMRAMLVGLAACVLGITLARIPGASAVSWLPAIFILAEFTGGWLAVAIAVGWLGAASLLIASPFVPLMLTAACALICARAIRYGITAIGPVLLLAAASVATGSMTSGGIDTTITPATMAVALIDACFNVAIATTFVIARAARAWWTPPLRRWRFDDALFVVTVVPLVPAAIFLRTGAEAHTAASWWTIAVICAVLVAEALVSLSAARVIRGLQGLLRKGRMLGVRRRSSFLARELAQLFLAARRVSDGLHRRTALQELRLESARLKVGRLQQQAEGFERERRRMDLALRRAAGAAEETDRRWRSFLNAMPEAMFITDVEGRIEYASQGVRALLGFEPEKLAGTRLAALVPSAQSGKDPFEFEMSDAPEGADPPPLDRNARFCDSRGALRELSVRAQVFHLEEGRRLAIRLREAADPMPRARDQFVATMSHEIRTPLHGLMATLDMLRSESLSVRGSRQLAIARTSAKTLIRIANDVLDLTRISAGGMQIERKPMNIDRLVSDVVDETRSREEALSLEVHAEIGRSLPPAVLGDPVRIKQVLRNLVSNALKFTTAGSVTVSADWFRDTCTIDVTDTGPGIPVEQRESIFEAFVQASGARAHRLGGAGLGLAISRQLSEAMGGSLSLLRSGPQGSTFRMVLPMPATDEVPLDEQSQRNLLAVKGRVLVAEDDDASRYVAQSLLESLECPATIVANGIEALEMLRTGEFDLALLDCEMPGLDGYEVTSRVRRVGGRRIPIIAMTASTMSADRQRCFDAGMDDLLSKPFGKTALNEMLGKWLSPQPAGHALVPLAQELSTRPELDSEVFEELRHSLNWQVPPLRKIYRSIGESSQKALDAIAGGAPPDLDLAQRRLHSLQGGAGLVGARQIEHVAFRLSQALREGRSQEVADGLPVLLGVLRRFEKVLERRFETLNSR